MKKGMPYVCITQYYHGLSLPLQVYPILPLQLDIGDFYDPN